uniref:C-type lectin domain-containing protein n=1 Tax=Hucho hucho TaxID=62062 RepID=A0A4W5N8D6_9TELE
MLVCSPQGCLSSPHNVGLFSTGLSILPSYLPHQFHFVNMKMTWTEAQSICRQNYTDLATIDDDMADMKKLNNTIAATSSWGGSAWIGLYDIIWRWCLGNRNLKGMGFWLDGKPKQPYVCVSMMLNGSWHDDNCDSLWPFVCYDEKQTKVIKRYILITVKKTWSEAQSYCRKEHTKLASVTNAAEVEAILKPDNNQPVLFDLKKYCGVWSDQSGSSYRNWDSDEPNWGDGGDYCGEVKSSGMWNDAGCHHTKNFICYDGELETNIHNID